MSVNTAEIGVVYDALATKMTNTLDELFNSYTLTDEGRANIIAQSITTIIQVSSQLVQSQPKVDADVAIVGKQGSMIDAQILTEGAKKLQTERQTTAYNDQLRIKEAELLTNVVGMMGAGGATFSTADAGGKTVLTEMYNKLDAITPV